ncbi:MAG TPA: hypothetical protein VK498_03885 [Ferruginibacter sp.]|nr:hypothetical protein [Ferruginibacter sp.]
MNIETSISDWINTSNAFGQKKYLEFYLGNAVLDDPSVGRKFIGHDSIKDYFVSYFIGYNTRTELLKLKFKTNITLIWKCNLQVIFPKER